MSILSSLHALLLCFNTVGQATWVTRNAFFLCKICYSNSQRFSFVDPI